MSDVEAKPVCGIVMPISAIDGCGESHWADVLEILTEGIEEAGFDANLVSNADESGLIHKRIIQNLYENPVVVCDVSGKNPNVMFELGLRLAFDKPTVIIKDEKTSYSFDTSGIEHLEYPRDLRFSRIVEFKRKLAEKISATYKRAMTDSGYTTFLRHFGEFKVAKIEKKEVPGQELILDELRALRAAMRRLEGPARNQASYRKPEEDGERTLNICLEGLSETAIKEFEAIARHQDGVMATRISEREPGHHHLHALVRGGAVHSALESKLRSLLGSRRRRQRQSEVVGGGGEQADSLP